MAVTPEFVLFRPSLPENVGAAARAMANFDLDRLCVVGARGIAAEPRAVATAADGAPVLARARAVDTLSAAIGSAQRVYATAATDKRLRVPTIGPRELAARLRSDAAAGLHAAVVFGPERTGLTYDELGHADALVRIPTSDACRALNLGQAVLLVAWEHAAAAPVPPAAAPAEPPAPRDAIDGFFGQLDEVLRSTSAFGEPPLRARLFDTLRALAFRAGPTVREVNTARGVLRALSRG